jgi:hypothetical protein
MNGHKRHPVPPLRAMFSHSVSVRLRPVLVVVLFSVSCAQVVPPAPAPSPAPCTCEEGFFCCESTMACVPTGGACGEGCDSAVPIAAKAMLETHCYGCHGKAGAVEGGFNTVLEVQKLIDGRKVIPGDTRNSSLYQRVVHGDMPPRSVKVRPSEAEVAALARWIECGAPALVSPQTGRTFIRDEEMIRMMGKDIEALPAVDREFTRYFTLTHLYNAGMSDDELQSYRSALAKLVNGLSWGNQIAVPIPIDSNKTIMRIDLRDYQWVRRNIDQWRSVIEAYPYGILRNGSASVALASAAKADLAYVRGDWFVASASQPPLYHQILGLPSTTAELEKLLQVDAAHDLETHRAMRAGFSTSGVSQHNRLIERYVSPFGAYWKSYDFAGSSGKHNLFTFPLGPGTGPRQFLHDGGELIFNLPNGLQGYMLVDAAGGRIDKGPSEIVSDPARPDRRVVNGLSCMSCHVQGIIFKDDQIRAKVEANPAEFSAAERDAILALYPERDVMTARQQQDRNRFQAAVKEAGLSDSITEPTVVLAHAYEQNMDLKLSAAELGLTPDELTPALDAPRVAAVLGPLKVKGQTLKREVFQTGFAELVCALSLGAPRQFSSVGGTCEGVNECALNNGDCDPLTTCTDTAVGRTCGACPAGHSGDGERGCVGARTCAAQNGGCDPLVTCTNSAAGPTCGACPTGYFGDGATGCTDVNECKSNNGACDALTACINTVGSRTCGACPSGYTGSGTAGCVDIDECATNNGGCGAQPCTNTPGGRSCGTCSSGYMASGGTCVDLNECQNNNGGCDARTSCTNTPGSRTCGPCPAGYLGSGTTACTDINECQTANGGCDSLTTCTNIPGGRTCGPCPGGYSGNGVSGCVSTNQCAVNNGGCHSLTTCTNTSGGRTCGPCPTGYTGTGLTGCTDINECLTNNGGCGAMNCTNTPGSRTCAGCAAGNHLCNGLCVANTSVSSCGSSCSPCTPPANATATCDGLACGFVCSAGTRSCGGACAACPNVANGAFTCNGTQCVSNGCAPGYNTCATGCCAMTDTLVAQDYLPKLSLVVNSSLVPHIAFASQSLDQLLLWKLGASGTWTSESVGREPDDFQLAINPVSQRLQVATAGEVGLSDREIAYVTRATGSSQWSSESVTSTGIAATLAIDSLGVPHIICKTLNTDTMYAVRSGTTWTKTTINTSSATKVSLALDPSGRPRFSYYDRGNLNYAAFNGTAWTLEVVDSTNYAGFENALAIDTSGTPHIAYTERYTGSVKYAVKTGSTWTIETVATDGENGSQTSLAITPAGERHLLYHTSNGRLRHARRIGSTWSSALIDPPRTANGRSDTSDAKLVIDAAGRLHVAYAYFTGTGYEIHYLH